MRLLDTREQKSPRFLIEALPDIVQTQLEVGDYFTGNLSLGGLPPRGTISTTTPAHLVEIKIGNDFGIHTEQLERFQDECYRMACWRQKNPHVELHAVWVYPNHMTTRLEERVFYNLCFKYHIWGHVLADDEALIEFLKALDQPSQYVEFEPYIKKSHTEPTILAKMLRQFPGISSSMAIELANKINRPIGRCYWANWERGMIIKDEVREIIYDTIGRKKNGEPKKLALDLIRWLEEGY